MKKIYTFLNVRTMSVLFASALLTSNTVMAQPTCGPIVQNFDNTGGSTAGFTGSFSYATDGSDGYLVRNRVLEAPNTYSITTPTYTLPQVANSIGYGFELGGTERVYQVIVNILYVSNITQQVESYQLDQFIAQYDPLTGLAKPCGLVNFVNNTTIPGFAAGSSYRLQFIMSSRTGSGLDGQRITFDDFRTNGTASLSPLPVTFVGFEARKINNTVQLTWKVAGEENVSHYEVERSNDGRSFATIGSVSKTGRDTYTYADASNISTAYYRIKNVDNDGQFKYSTIARIANGRSELVLKAFPQPVQSQLTIQHPSISGKALVSISTADGRTVRSIVPANGSIQTNVNMSGLQRGMYMIRFDSGDGQTQTLKVLKQ